MCRNMVLQTIGTGQSCPLPEIGIEVFDDAPVFTPEDMLARLDRQHGEGGVSCPVAVGRLVLSPEHVAILESLEVPYGEIYVPNLDLPPSWRGPSEEQQNLCKLICIALREIVEWDMARANLSNRTDELTRGLWAGIYSERTFWHPDGGGNYPRAMMKWGVGSLPTQFAVGTTRPDMFYEEWALREGHAIGPNKDLKPFDSVAWVVYRFQYGVDVHSAPDATDHPVPRIFATLTSPALGQVSGDIVG